MRLKERLHRFFEHFRPEVDKRNVKYYQISEALYLTEKEILRHINKLENIEINDRELTPDERITLICFRILYDIVGFFYGEFKPR